MGMVNEVLVEYKISSKQLDDRRVHELISRSRTGVAYDFFDKLQRHTPFTVEAWSSYLPTTTRTLQRQKAGNKAFKTLQTERILRLALLFQKGIAVFGDEANFFKWTEQANVALGGERPKAFFDSTFGIDMINDELSRIEHGVLA